MLRPITDRCKVSKVSKIKTIIKLTFSQIINILMYSMRKIIILRFVYLIVHANFCLYLELIYIFNTVHYNVVMSNSYKFLVLVFYL